VFFSTVADPTITEAKSISTSITSTTLTDYYLPISTKAGWTGTLKRLRIDPINSQNAFKIDSVTLLYTATPMTLNVNQTAVPLLNNPISLNSHYLIPMAPDTGVFNYFNSYFEWNKASGNLTMYGNNHTIAFTMGSSNASVDGVTTALGCTPYLLDGIPMVPVDAITTAFGYTISYGTGTIDVTTPFSAFYDVFRNNANNIWEFNVPNYPEGWTFYQMASDFSQTGAIGGSATITGGGTYDPIMFSPTLNITGGTYSKVKVGMKHALTTATSGTAKIFYITSTSTSYSADKCITGTPTVTPQSSGTNYIEYTFDISAITGTITQIRFDPFDAQGSFYVDYVRFQQ
jgi:Copper amine oxidase N-terminal domain.